MTQQKYVLSHVTSDTSDISLIQRAGGIVSRNWNGV